MKAKTRSIKYRNQCDINVSNHGLLDINCKWKPCITCCNPEILLNTITVAMHLVNFTTIFISEMEVSGLHWIVGHYGLS